MASDKGGAFQVTRTAAGKIPAQRKAPKVAPVEVTKGVQKFQTKQGRTWHTVCSVPDGERGRTNLRYHYGAVLGRTEGKDFRFTVHKR